MNPGKVNREHCLGWDWTLWKQADGSFGNEQAQLSVLMDIRDELQKLNALLHCPNFTGIPHALSAIKKNTTKKRATRRKP